MIYIFLGDDVSTSRQEFIQFKQSLVAKDYSITEINESNIDELNMGLYQANTLFESKNVFVCENLFAKVATRKKFLPFDNTDKNTIILDWEEDCDDKAIKFSFKNTIVKQSKLSENIFKLMDSIFPKNLKAFISYLDSVSGNINENIILFMIQKRIKELIFVKNNIESVKKMQSWQIARLKGQASTWDKDKLLSLYEALYRIETNLKTSRSPLGLKKALDMLFCYYI
jgi:hypothetical protein